MVTKAAWGDYRLMALLVFNIIDGLKWLKRHFQFSSVEQAHEQLSCPTLRGVEQDHETAMALLEDLVPKHVISKLLNRDATDQGSTVSEFPGAHPKPLRNSTFRAFCARREKVVNWNFGRETRRM